MFVPNTVKGTTNFTGMKHLKPIVMKAIKTTHLFDRFVITQLCRTDYKFRFVVNNFESLHEHICTYLTMELYLHCYETHYNNYLLQYFSILI